MLQSNSELDRPEWDQYFLSGAVWAASRGDCRRARVGALLVKDRKVRGVGYNGTVPGLPGCLEGACPRGLKTREEVPSYSPYTDCISDHAERNAIRNTNPHDVKGATLYVTIEPCAACRTLIQSVKIARVVWKTGEWLPGGQS